MIARMINMINMINMISTVRSGQCSRALAKVTVALLAPMVTALLMLVGCEERLPLTWKAAELPAADTPEGFTRLWGTNCAGCHGAEGSHGPARPMNDPIYLATLSDSELERVIAHGSATGTLMPGFSNEVGGALTNDEISAIVSGMRRAWGRSDAKPLTISYAAPTTRGDPVRGKAAFERSCIACHASDQSTARGATLPPGVIAAGSVTDPFYLQLISDQALRSSIIFGRADLGMPGAAGPFPNRPAGEGLSAQEVDDIVAWLAERRVQDWPPASIRRGGRP